MRILKPVIIGAAILIVLVALAWTALAALLRAEAGRAWIAAKLSELLTSEPHRRVEIQGLEGDLPREIRIGRISIHDAEGLWLSLDGLRVTWSPIALLHGEIHLPILHTEVIHLTRTPKPGPESGESEAETDWTELKLPPLRVDSLTLATVHLEQAVVGQKASFVLVGALGAEDRRVRTPLRLHLERIDDGPSLWADLEMGLTAGSPGLDLRIDLEEQGGGWVAALAGLKSRGTLQLRLHGEGPLSDWSGQLFGALQGRGRIDAALYLAAAREIDADVIAEVRLEEGALPPEFEAVRAAGQRFRLTGRLLPRQAVVVDRLEAQSEGLVLSGHGRLSLESDQVDGALMLRMDDLGSIGAAVGTPLRGQGALCGSVRGTLGSPEAVVGLEISRLAAHGIEARSLHTELELKPAVDQAPLPGAGWRLAGEGAVAGLAYSDGKKLPEDTIAYTLEAEMGAKDEPLQAALRLTGDRLRLALQGSLSPATTEGRLEATLAVTDLKPFTALLGRELDGKLELTSEAHGNAGRGTGAATLQGTIVTKESESRILGGKTSLNAALQVEEGGVFKLINLSLKGPAIGFEGHGSVDRVKSRAAAKGALSVSRLELLAPLIQEDLSGALEGTFDIDGPLDDFKGAASVRARNVRWRDMEFKELRADAEARHLPRRPDGRVRLTAQHAGEKLEASGGFAVDGPKVSLTGLRARAPGGSLDGDLALRTDGPAPLIQGSLQGKADNLAKLGRLFGRKLQGSATLRANLSAPNGAQDAALELRGSSIRTDHGSLSRLEAAADLKDLHRKLQGKVRLDLSDFQSGQVTVKSMSLRADGDGARMVLSGEARGRAAQSFDLQTRGSLGRSDELLRLELAEARGSFGPYPFRLLAPLSLERSQKALSLTGLALSLGPGRVTLSAGLSDDRVQTALLADSIPLQLVSMLGGPELTGSARARLDLDGPPTQPGADIELRLSDIRTPVLKSRQQPRPAQVMGSARLERGRLQGSIELSQMLDEPARADFSLPLQVSLGQTFALAIPRNQPLQAHVDFQGELAQIALYVPLADQTFSGRAQGSLDVSGTLASPSYGGAIQIAGGAYENLSTGSVFKDVAATLVARDRFLEVQQFMASDGERGRVRLQGSMEFDLEKRFPLSLEALFDHAIVVRRTDLTATANGSIKAEGSLQALSLTGAITVGPAEYVLPARLPPSLADLDVIHVNRDNGKPASKEEKEEAGSPPVAVQLGLKVGLVRPVYVRGRGLDSEWRGELDIQGTGQTPLLTGRLHVTRGRFDFLDRSFSLTQGTVTFHGSSPPTPYLDFTAESKAKDITAILKISGPASTPQIEITSDPPLPKEEVLARILFGRGTDKFTPVQALKLAQALRTLSGDESLPMLDVLGGTRKLLGLDRLELRASEGESQTGVGLGKYLTEDIYVDVQKDLGGAGGKISLEVELTPSLTIESQVGSNAETGIGVNWKRDY